MKIPKLVQTTACLATALLLGISQVAQAGSQTWDFSTDPATELELAGTDVNLIWQQSDGNPGGFLALCYPIDSWNSTVVFPDIDNGELVTSFTMSADIRSGNPEDDRAADGWSISLARGGDPFLASRNTADLAAGLPEAGTTTGIAISFDTWSGNALPDTDDLEGILVRVDNVTVGTLALPTRSGECDDATSLQTGLRDVDFWALDPPPTNEERQSPDGWDTLCWQPLVVTVDEESKVTVTWKGQTVLDGFQTDFFPSIGRIVLSARTGGSNSQVHFDNISLTTATVPPDTSPPTTPENFTVTTAGAGVVQLAWDEATDNQGRVAYELERDSAAIGPAQILFENYEDRSVLPNTSYTYRVRSVDLSLNTSDWATVTTTTGSEADTIGYVRSELVRNIGGVLVFEDFVNPLLQAGEWPDRVDEIRYLNGLQFGEWNGFGGDNFGDNFGIRVIGTITPLVSGDYRFFVRGDDGCEFHINPNSTDPIDVNNSLPDAVESGCCGPFEEVGAGENTQVGYEGTFPTSEPISLTAGTPSAFIWMVKEGGGGDWGAVAWRLEGDDTPAASLQPITGVVLTSGKADADGAQITFTQEPQDVTAAENGSASFTASVDVTSLYPATDNPGHWQQWLKNGQPIPGETGDTLVIPVVALADNGATYALQVGASALVLESAAATMTVEADVTPPTIVSGGQTDDSFTSVTVTYSEQVQSHTASSYALDNGASVTGVALSADRTTVTLTTSALTEGTDYTLTVNNVQDNKGLSIAADTQVEFTSLVQILSSLAGSQWLNVSGTAIVNLTDDPRYPDTPDNSVDVTNGLEIGSRNGNAGWNDSLGDNYGIRVTGVFTVPGTADYHFFIRSDDASQFFLNTSGPALPDTAGEPLIREDGCCAAFLEPGTDQASTTDALSLVEGDQHGFVILLKEGGGGDGVAVGFRAVGDTTPAADLPSIPEYGPKVTAIALPPTLTVGMSGADVVITYEGTLESAATVDGTYAPVAGAASPYTVTPDSTMFYRSAN